MKFKKKKKKKHLNNSHVFPQKLTMMVSFKSIKIYLITEPGRDRKSKKLPLSDHQYSHMYISFMGIGWIQ